MGFNDPVLSRSVGAHGPRHKTDRAIGHRSRKVDCQGHGVTEAIGVQHGRLQQLR